jgi:ABC-type nickel/cobalt efflux system permease component RcnA
VPSRRRIRLSPFFVVGLGLVSAAVPAARAHDIPNQRIDRSIQVSLRPGLLEIDYEVSLTELTLTQDLRALIGGLPGADRAEWLARYGQVTGPLNRKGLVVSIDGQPVRLAVRGFDLAVEEHPVYTFHFTAPIPRQGLLEVRDTNYVSSEGTSRLAVRGRDGIVLSGDDLPPDVERIEIRPVWLLSDEQERRTRQVKVRLDDTTVPSQSLGHREPRLGETIESKSSGSESQLSVINVRKSNVTRISQLLDDSTRLSWSILLVLALALGAVHAIQPGHGKTLVTAVALGPGARPYQPALLAVATAMAHAGSVLLIAILLWGTGATQVGTVHVGLTRIAGFMIAAAGFWRVGRHSAGFGEHEPEDLRAGEFSNRSVLGLGLAGGMVPCWDAVGLLVVAAAVGRLATGVKLVLAFSIGMAAVLVAVGCLAWKIKSAALRRASSARWQRRLGLAGAIMLSGMGLILFLQS